MAKAVVAILICIVALAIVVVPPSRAEHFDVQGTVYCDPCRVGFITTLSKNIPDAVVRLQCINIENGTIVYFLEGKTDAQGKYVLHVDHNREHDICEVIAIHSPDPNCGKIMDTDLATARIECSANDGQIGAVRFANPLAFVPAEPQQPACSVLLQQIALDEAES